MVEPTNPNAISALERLMQEMQYLVDHPRIQQRTWVANGRRWLPILHIIYGELTGIKPVEFAGNGEDMARETKSKSILVEVNAGGGQTFVNIRLEDIAQLEVYRGGEPGHRLVRGAHSGFTLKDGRKYLTNSGEAQRIVDALRQPTEPK